MAVTCVPRPGGLSICTCPPSEASETASVRAGSSHSVVANVDVQLLVLNPCRDGSASSARMLGEVRQRFCDDEVRVRLDLGTEPVSGHLDANGQTQAFGQPTMQIESIAPVFQGKGLIDISMYSTIQSLPA